MTEIAIHMMESMIIQALVFEKDTSIVLEKPFNSKLSILC